MGKDKIFNEQLIFNQIIKFIDKTEIGKIAKVDGVESVM